MSKQSSKASVDAFCRICVGLGSSPQLIIATACAEIWKRSKSVGLHVKPLFFDFLPHINPNCDSLLGVDTAQLFGPEAFVQAVLRVDRKALERAEKDGRLWCMPEGWHADSTITKDNMGASGKPRIGLMLANLNARVLTRRLDRLIQEVMDHRRGDETAVTGGKGPSHRGRIQFDVFLSAVGATGSGSVHWFLEAIGACAKRNGVEASIVLHLLCRGNLDVHDVTQANLNEYIATKHVLVLRAGSYVNPFTGMVVPVPFSSLFFSSSQNGNGNMMEVETLQLHEGHCEHFLYNTRAGSKVLHRLPDVLVPRFGRGQEPLVANTVSCVFIGRDPNRVLGFYKHKAAACFSDSLLAEGHASLARREAVAWARQNGIVESDTENQLTGPVLKSGESQDKVIEVVKASFRDRIGNSKALDRIRLIEDALESVENEVQSSHVPMMRTSVRRKLRSLNQTLDMYLDRTMRTSHGLSDARNCLAYLKTIATMSADHIARKESELREYLSPHEQIIAESLERAEHLAKRNRLVRLAYYPLVRRVALAMEESALAVIDYQLQITACAIANDLTTSLIDELNRRLTWLSMAMQKLKQLTQVCENTAEAVASAPTTAHVSNGIELTNRDYLDDHFRRQVAKYGGAQKLADEIRGRFLSRHGTMAMLAEASLEECLDAFAGICSEMFRRQVEASDAASEFRAQFPDENRQRVILAQLIKDSEGRFPVRGEIDEPVVWIKAVNVPKPEHVEWIRSLLTSVDPKDGKWEVAVDESDPDRISILQLRGGISLAHHLESLDVADDEEGWARVIDQAPDPGSAILVPPNPTMRQFRRVLTKGIANDQITFNDRTGFMFSSSSAEELSLGKDLESMEKALRPLWPQLVFIESTFNRSLVVAEKAVLARLEQIYAALKSNQPEPDPRLKLIDVVAVEECLKQSELLLPRLRRITKALGKEYSE